MQQIKNHPLFMKLKLLATLTGIQKIFYIGGSDTLPPPLNKPDEEYAINQMIQGSLHYKQLLIEHNLRLVVYIAKRFENTGIGLEDLISLGTIGLIKGIGTYTPGKNLKLAT